MFDADARRHAVDPSQNVVLEASAGTGKTRVLVERYVNLLLAGVEPERILAITFTRKAAAEMRQRIVARLREAGRTSQMSAARWRDLRERLSDIAISTIDAFCLSLIREFPLEAGIDPGFDLADQTEIPRLIGQALDRALRIGRHLAQTDDDVAMVFVQLPERRLRQGLAALVDRRLVAADVLRRFLDFGPKDLTPALACRRAADRLSDLLNHVAGGSRQFFDAGPLGHPQFAMLADDLTSLLTAGPRDYASRGDQAAFRMLVDRVRSYFLTLDGTPRKAQGLRPVGIQERALRVGAGLEAAPRPGRSSRALDRTDRAGVPARPQRHRLARCVAAVSDRADAVPPDARVARGPRFLRGARARAVGLLKQMEEFSQSRYKLEARYQHVLVDEFQDTNRAQWELMSLLVRSWGEGFGAAADALQPTIFLVGDRKQSIYGFRDAEVAMLDEAAGFVARLRPDGQPRQAISISFRAVPELLSFVNELFAEIASAIGCGAARCVPVFRDRSVSDRCRPRTPVRVRLEADGAKAVKFLAAATIESAADGVADEIAAILSSGEDVRDRDTGVARRVRPADIAVVFRSRDSHREYEAAIDRRGIPTYVYKGLGFFEADEIQDAISLLRFLASPTSNLRAAAFLRSRIVRLSEAAVIALRTNLAGALVDAERSARDGAARRGGSETYWSGFAPRSPDGSRLVDRVTPSELLDGILRETAYAYEIRGPRRAQARENLKKLRALIRKVENRGYATLARIAEFLDDLAVGDESNAVHRRARRRQPDDRARGQGPGISDRVRREHQPRHRRAASADSRAGRRLRHAVGVDRRFRIGGRRRRDRPRTRGNEASALRRADARARSAVPRCGRQEWRVQARPRKPRRGAAAGPSARGSSVLCSLSR